MRMRRFQEYLPTVLHTALDREAETLGISKSEIIRRALDEYFAHRSAGPLPDAVTGRRRRVPQEAPDGA